MASELRVNTLKDASGNNSVAMSTVSNGTPKGFAYWNQLTPAIVDSMNASSLTDSAQGVGSITWTSAMSSASYMCTTGAPSVATNTPYVTAAMDDAIYDFVTKTSTSWPFNTAYSADGGTAAYFDSKGAICAAMGDLA